MEYKWIISALDCATSKNGLNTVIENIHWRYRGTSQSGVTSEMYDVQELGEPVPEEFVDYENLTLSTIISWLEGIIDVLPLKTEIEARINLLENPTHITLPPPTT